MTIDTRMDTIEIQKNTLKQQLYMWQKSLLYFPINELSMKEINKKSIIMARFTKIV